MRYEIGTKVFGDWEIVRELGEGSYGKVFEIRKKSFDIVVSSALKVIRIPRSVSDIKNALSEGMDEKSVTTYFQGMVSEILKEIATMNRVKGHGNIVSYEDHCVLEREGEIGWDILIRMELLTSLTDYQLSHKMTEKDVRKMASDLLTALVFCQKQGMIHRDIKPENIFVNADGQFKLGDFGVARTAEKTMGGMSKKGTENYMAPEVYHGRPYGASVDVYSLGLVLYRFMNKNRLPFLPPAPKDITFSDRENALVRRMRGDALPYPVDAGEGFAKIILKACEADTKKRYHIAGEMLEDLKKLNDSKKVLSDMKEEIFVEVSEEDQDQCETIGIDFGFTEEIPDSKQDEGERTIGIWDEIPEEIEEKEELDETIEEKPSPKEGGRFKMMIPLICALVAVIMGIFLFGGSKESGNSQQIASETQEIESTVGEVLPEEMQTETVQPEDGTMGKNVLGSGYDLLDGKGAVSKIRKITFLDSLANVPAGAKDVSADGDRSVMSWIKNEEHLYLAADGKIKANPDSSELFREYTAVTDIEFNNVFDTSLITDMSYMFDDCDNLISIDLSSFDTSNVTNMMSMFSDCKDLSSVDISGFDTSQVTNMRSMFYGCKNLSSVDISGFDTSQVTDMGHMFYYCENLSSVDVSGFDTSQVTDMGYMFWGCEILRDINVSGFDTSQVTNMGHMFASCRALEYIDVSGFDTSQVTDMSNMFAYCNELKTLDVSGFNTSRVTDMSSMFSSCGELTDLNVSGFDTNQVTNMSFMFSGCENLTYLDVSRFKTGRVTDMSWMFGVCTQLTDLDLSNFSMHQVTDNGDMFTGCDSLSPEVYAGIWEKPIYY